MNDKEKKAFVARMKKGRAAAKKRAGASGARRLMTVKGAHRTTLKGDRLTRKDWAKIDKKAQGTPLEYAAWVRQGTKPFHRIPFRKFSSKQLAARAKFVKKYAKKKN